ncbi:hypothetical protein TRICI_003561 [Trichomonascus ciferrii]|uniref:Uncharacterized protein n=1 Tax=Trichomonascus ciferrii TaxID=44093 RepID=A0A642V9U0_9ASCO|nr:hypothetical protein TRICI_003561 [Trichomonascus ciferrii]
MVEWQQVLGKSRASEELRQIYDKSSLKDPETIRTYPDGAEYHCFFKVGVAICFMKDKVDSVDFYKHDKLYTTVPSSLLPSGISLEMTGEEFVGKYGEPSEKAGGFQKHMDIWLRWPESGIQVEFQERDWDAGQKKSWSGLTLFHPS